MSVTQESGKTSAADATHDAELVERVAGLELRVAELERVLTELRTSLGSA